MKNKTLLLELNSYDAGSGGEELDAGFALDASAYTFDELDKLYQKYSKLHPEWHLKRYYTHPEWLLEHIYHCARKNTVKELLYKAELEYLAAYSRLLDEVNLLAAKPSDLFDGITMRTLRALNCREGALLLAEHRMREFLKRLQSDYPSIFESKMNDAQCRYLHRLIVGEMTVAEAGRIYLAGRKKLQKIWSEDQYALFVKVNEVEEQIRYLNALDPIYGSYIRDLKKDGSVYDWRLSELIRFLGPKREQFDERIRRGNRKRNPDWQERTPEYIVRFPQTINDFCREGVYMRNCLLSYSEAMLSGDSTILFMRRAQDVNTPFITIEIQDNRLVQYYHRFNQKCNAAEEAWIFAYCERHGISTEVNMWIDIEEDMFFDAPYEAADAANEELPFR